MREPNRAIFRAGALQRRARSQEQVVFPRLIAPPVFACLWLLLGLLLAAAVVTWGATVPLDATGPAVVVDPRAGVELPAGGDTVVLLPPDTVARVRAGQPLRLRPVGGAAGAAPTGVVVAVLPERLGPAEARRRFALGEAVALTQPVGVVVARLIPAGAGADRDALAGSVYTAEIEIGSRRVLALVPGLAGRLEGD